ncbi:MAG: ABC transporter ATP-binding protein [Thermodesulfobacteriota bacterium]
MGGRRIEVLRSVNLDLMEGDFMAIMGRSGSGKSTLLHILGCLDVPSSGTYTFDSLDVNSADDDQLSRIRGRAVGFVFQDFHLLSAQTVFENVALPFLYNKVDRKVVHHRVEEAVGRVGLSDRLEHRPSELSGGEMQRVAIARALVVQPRVILADEPTGNLDEESSREVMRIFTSLHNLGVTIVMVTHDKEVAARAETIRVLRQGQLEREEAAAGVS